MLALWYWTFPRLSLQLKVKRELALLPFDLIIPSLEHRKDCDVQMRYIGS